MHLNPAIPTSVLYGFLLVLARFSGVFVFLPLPGFQAGPSAAKITLAMILTFGMYSRWPALDPLPESMLQVAGWMLAEAAIGLATGLAVAILIEAVTFAAQAISTGTNRFICTVRCKIRWPKAAAMRSGVMVASAL